MTDHDPHQFRDQNLVLEQEVAELKRQLEEQQRRARAGARRPSSSRAPSYPSREELVTRSSTAEVTVGDQDPTALDRPVFVVTPDGGSVVPERDRTASATPASPRAAAAATPTSRPKQASPRLPSWKALGIGALLLVALGGLTGAVLGLWSVWEGSGS